MFPLQHIDIEISKKCNLKCIHCSADASLGPQELDNIDTLKNILVQGIELGAKKIGFTGGEPFLFPNALHDLIDFAVTRGSTVHLHTNGTLTEQAVSIVGDDNLRNMTDITLPLLGGDERDHDEVTGVKGSFTKMVNSAHLFSKKQYPLTIFVIPMQRNISKLLNGIDLLYREGVKKFRLMALAPGGRARIEYQRQTLIPENVRFIDTELEKKLTQYKDIVIDGGFCTRLSFGAVSTLKGHDLCMSAINRVHINGEGNVFPCTAASGIPELAAGNIYKTSLREIWEKSPLLQDIRNFRETVFRNCVGCDLLRKCLGGCRVSAFFHTRKVTKRSCLKNIS